MDSHSASSTPLAPRQERTLLWLLAAIQFTTMLDFLIMMPLGPQYMRIFKITPAEFGHIVSAYAIAAGVAGVIAALFLDRFERKRALAFVYGGFCIGTLLCAIAPGYFALVAARTVAGGFGGVTGALIMALVGDVIPANRRGRAMGLIMSAFSVASILGVPIGLFAANHLGWQAPFIMLTVLSALVLAGTWWMLPLLKKATVARTESPWRELVELISVPNHIRALLFMAVVICTGFSLIPFISPYMVKNVGLKETELPYIYFFGGGATIFSMNIVGRLADKFGKLPIFTITVIFTIIPALLLTHLPHVAVWVAISVTTLFMVCMSGRMVPAMALMTTSIEDKYRGGFMSISSAVQSFASGMAALLGGAIVTEKPVTGELLHYGTVGIISAVCAIVSIFLARTVKEVNGKVPVATASEVPVV